jgi:hypothetical protein
MIPLGIVSAAGSSLVPLVSNVSFTMSGTYRSEQLHPTLSTYSSGGNGSLFVPFADIIYVGPMTITATLTGLPESGPGEFQPLSGKPLTFIYGINGTYPVPVTTTTDANGQAVFTIQSFGQPGPYGWEASITVQFDGENTGQVIYPSSRNRAANFYNYDAGGGAS